MEAPHLETLWRTLKNLFPDNIHIVSATTADNSAEELNGPLWRGKFLPNLTFYLSDKIQLGYTYPQFSDSYIPRSAVIGTGYKIKYNASGSPPAESEMVKWINDLISADITQPESQIAERAVLNQNYPNPFNPHTTISYELKMAGFTRLSVYNEKGELVQTLQNKVLQAGKYSTEFNAAGFNSGIYFCKLEVAGAVQINKMIYLK